MNLGSLTWTIQYNNSNFYLVCELFKSQVKYKHIHQFWSNVPYLESEVLSP